MRIARIQTKMPKKCLLCRAKASRLSKRSYHMFPKEEVIKQKWLDALKLPKTPNFKAVYICSDHFDPESFFYTDETRQRQRLCREAVPTRENIYCASPPRESEPIETEMIDIVKHEISDTTENANLSAISQENVMCKVGLVLDDYLELHKGNELEDASSQSDLIQEVDIGKNEALSIIPIKPEETNVTEDVGLLSSTETLTETYIEELPAIIRQTLNNNSSSSKTNRKRRKRPLNRIKGVKKVRFMNGFRTEYICREDFVSDEAWHRFLRYSTYQRGKTAAAHNKNSRKKKKIEILNRVINILRKGKVLDRG